MRVPWKDFRQACRKLLSPEDCVGLPAAWRALDDDLSGWLSLREFDRATFDQLTRFVSWVDQTYGSLVAAFPKLQHGNGQISQQEFRHLCSASGLGDTIARKIFLGLDVDMTGNISMNEVRFLNSWKVASDMKEEEAWASLTNARPTRKSFARVSILSSKSIQKRSNTKKF
jgi:Ca2+-binding EF-hand superfamily protein